MADIWTIHIRYAATLFAQSGPAHLICLRTHQKTGLVLFVLYTAQCTLGALVHFLKPLLSTRRPPQNYAHGLLGLVLVALAFWQVRTGYHAEWPHATGRGTSNGVNIAWIVWAVVSP